MRFITRPIYGDADIAAADSTDLAVSTAQTDPINAQKHMTSTDLFFVSVGAGITVWGITKLLAHLLGTK